MNIWQWYCTVRMISEDNKLYRSGINIGWCVDSGHFCNGVMIWKHVSCSDRDYHIDIETRSIQKHWVLSHLYSAYLHGILAIVMWTISCAIMHFCERIRGGNQKTVVVTGLHQIESALAHVSSINASLAQVVNLPN